MNKVLTTKSRVADGEHMPLPPREYFALDELPERWETTKERVQHYAETGRLKCCVWLKQSQVERGKINQLTNGKEIFQPQAQYWMKGFVRVEPEDCRWIFRKGAEKLSLFISLEKSHDTIKLVGKKPRRQVNYRDLVVLRNDLVEFESQYLSHLHNQEKMPKEFYHSDHYQTVEYKGFRFRFGITQANIVQQLHKASKTKNPWVHGKRLLDRSGSRSEQVKNVFRSQKQWREIIESDRRGYYRLKV